MDSNRIDDLLKKYWECETSLEEEKELKTYFNQEFDQKYKDVAPLFRYYEKEQNTGGLDGFFDERILAKIEKPQESIKKRGLLINMFLNASKVAAVGLIIATAGYFIKEEMSKEELKPYMSDTFEDPEKAFEETKKALQLISKNFNKGRKEVRKLSTFNEAQEKVKSDNQL
jgi:hypothetical protein